MTEGERRLVAIMFTDMVGYTALGQRNESLSLALVEEQRRLVRPILSRHNGREVKTMGDAFLVEFPNALDAVRCAYDIQRAIKEFNLSRPFDGRIHLRVGLHLGDVVESKGDIFGDAVNVASRIEPLAEDGGVCLTRQVYESVYNKFEIPIVSIGIKSLKNVSEPMEVYRLVMNREEKKGQEKAALLPSDRIAVLPFVNISPDPNDEYFADGLTEELISKLSQVKGLKVIARTSVMNYKKKETKASQIGAELGAGTLVEGSVRKAGNRIRVTVQVVDSNTEEHKWSTSYDRNLDDIFAVQTEIASRITESFPGCDVKAPAQREMGGTEDVDAYTAFLRAKQLLRQPTEQRIREAIGLFEEAVKLDPSFARAYVGLAEGFSRLGSEGYVPRKESEAPAGKALARALEITPDLAEAHALASLFAWYDDEMGKAEAEGKRAIELNPNLADAYASLAMLKSSMGYLSESVRLLEKARELNPLSPEIPILGQLYLYMGRESEALDLWKKLEKTDPASACSRMWEYELIQGRLDKAEELLAKLEEMVPNRVGVVGARGMLAAATGDKEQVQQTIRRLEQTYEGVGVMPNYVAYVYYMLGDLDETFRWLGKAVESHSLIPHVIRYSPLFARLRADPRYRQLLVSNGLDPDNKD